MYVTSAFPSILLQRVQVSRDGLSRDIELLSTAIEKLSVERRALADMLACRVETSRVIPVEGTVAQRTSAMQSDHDKCDIRIATSYYA